MLLQLKGCPSSEVDDRVEEMVKLLGLEPKADKESQTLSGGMKRKLCLGIAFIFGSKVIHINTLLIQHKHEWQWT